MSEDQPQEDQRALTVVKERLIAHSSEPMWDSAAFDHMGRVAAVMAESGLASDTLLNDDGGNPANPKTVVARMLLIAHMARECGANPLMFLQGCSRIGKKIHLEGKLVNAIVRARTGVNLRFQFGRWETDHIELPELHTEGEHKGLPVDPDFFKGAGERLAIRVSDPNDPERHVDGSVGLWKTDRRGSPWTSQGNWRRQLRYRGAPEWARAYEPGAVLGIYSEADQDIDEDIEVRPVGLMQRLKGTQEGDGFNAADVAAQTEKPKRKYTKRTADPEPVKETAETEHVDADVSEIGAEVDTSHAAPGETYLMAGDGYNGDNRRMTYRDGLCYSTVHKDSEGKHPEYAAHAPTPEILQPDEDGIPEHMRDDVGGGSISDLQAELSGVEPYQEGEEAPEGVLDRPTETAGVQPAEPEPDTSETATPASSDGPEPSGSGPSAAAENASPDPLAQYGEDVENCGSWDAYLTVMRGFFASEFFKARTPEIQNKIRARTWANLKELGRFALPDPISDIYAFRLFIEWCEDAEALSGSFVFLKKDPDAKWNEQSPAFQNAISSAVERRLKELG